jgi:hypothetical protein
MKQKLRLLGSMMALGTLGAALALAGCSDAGVPEGLDFGTDYASPPLPENGVVVATFVAHVSPKEQRVVFERVERDDGLLDPQSIDEINLSQDGTPGSGPPNTVELVTNSIGYNSACPGGQGNTWCANVTLRHFFTRPLSNVFVQMTKISLANRNAINSNQPEYGLDATKGLWKYTAPAAKTPGVLGLAPHNEASRDWVFNYPDDSGYSIELRVVASQTYGSYVFDVSSQTFVDACAGGTNLGTAATGTVTLPFLFTLYGTTSDKVNFSRRGVITVGGLPAPPLGANLDLPNTSAPRSAIFPFWDELAYGLGGAMCYRVTGATPNRQLVVTWKNMQFATDTLLDNPATLTFSAFLNEGSNHVHLVYDTLIGLTDRANGSGATVGVQNETATLATDELNAASFYSGDAYALIPVP